MRIFSSLLLITLWLSPTLRAEDTATAIFAGGCFWCMESDFQEQEGVLDVVSGFTGGKLENPTYDGDHRGHYEAVQITFDPDKVSYETLLQHYWRNIDPFDKGGQFCDRGHSYKAAVFYLDDAQRRQAESSKAEVSARFPRRDVVTEVLPATRFWPVKDYHQDYYLKNPVRYKFYRWNCGRDQRLKDIWGESAGH
jgi:peptide-methionine (S)-S-oxide reductase